MLLWLHMHGVLMLVMAAVMTLLVLSVVVVVVVVVVTMVALVGTLSLLSIGLMTVGHGVGVGGVRGVGRIRGGVEVGGRVGGEGVGVGASGIVPMCLFSTLMEGGTTGLAVGLVGFCREFGVVAMLFL